MFFFVNPPVFLAQRLGVNQAMFSQNHFCLHVRWVGPDSYLGLATIVSGRRTLTISVTKEFFWDIMYENMMPLFLILFKYMLWPPILTCMLVILIIQFLYLCFFLCLFNTAETIQYMQYLHCKNVQISRFSRSLFLSALSSSRSLVVGWSVG